MGIPLNKKHAIESASFILAYEKPFPLSLSSSLSALQDLLREDLPIFQALNVIEFKFDQENPQTPSYGKEAGVFLQSTNDEGKQTWGLRVEANHLIVTAFQYESWDAVSNHAFKLIKTAGNLLADQENPLAVVGYQVIDKFISQASDDYNIGDVFNTKSEFLTKHALTAGKLWHVFQGWFEEPASNNGRLLNVLNIATNDTVDGIVTTIDHNVQIQGRISSTEVIKDEWLRNSFNELHSANKNVMAKTLNSKQKKAIKL